MRFMLTPLLALVFGLGSLIGAQPAPPPAPRPPAAPKVPDDPKPDPGRPDTKPGAKKHAKGFKLPSPAVLKAQHDAAFARHGNRVEKLPRVTAATFDCATAPGYVVLGTDDQGQCGCCFGVSSADVCSVALARAGVLPATEAGRLSSQYGLDNSQAFQGGCDGGDEAQVIDFIKTQGFPLTKDYGSYTASAGRLKPLTGMQIYKIGDWGYCTPSQQQGMAAVADIKACMVQYGPISWAGDAGQFDSYQSGTIVGNGTNVDHATIVEGWDDTHDNGDGSKGAWIGRNQWGMAAATTVSFQSSAWGMTINGVSGRFWCKYGADSWGTEAIWVTAGTPPPAPPVVPPTPVPPTPVPPTPVPPGPPTPTPTNTGTVTFGGTGTSLDGMTYKLAPQGSEIITPATTLSELGTILQSFAGKPIGPTVPVKPIPPVSSVPPVVQPQFGTYSAWYSDPSACANGACAPNTQYQYAMPTQRRGLFGWRR